MWTQAELALGVNAKMQQEGDDLQQLAMRRLGGKLLRAKREELGLTMEGIQEQTGGFVKLRWMHELETGKKEDPGIDRLAALAKLYDITLDQLYGMLRPPLTPPLG